MALSRRKRKELHLLERPGLDVQAYRRLFGPYAGEWTPYYLRSPVVAPIAAEAINDDTVVLVLLRDPVDRFASAMRHYESRRSRRAVTPELRRLITSDVTWGGMYAAQLDAWSQAVGTERLMVMQYEAVRADPETHVNLVWRRLGLAPAPLDDTERPSGTTSQKDRWEWPDGLSGRLEEIYTPDVRRLPSWGVELSLWPRFAHLVAESGNGAVDDGEGGDHEGDGKSDGLPRRLLSGLRRPRGRAEQDRSSPTGAAMVATRPLAGLQRRSRPAG